MLSWIFPKSLIFPNLGLSFEEIINCILRLPSAQKAPIIFVKLGVNSFNALIGFAEAELTLRDSIFFSDFFEKLEIFPDMLSNFLLISSTAVIKIFIS